MGCSPIKAVRELGLERRETVVYRAVYKLGYLLETPSVSCATRSNSLKQVSSDFMRSDLLEHSGSDNATGAVNQQERLDLREVALPPEGLGALDPESSETICRAPPP